MWMKDYLQLDGLVYKLIPIETKLPSQYDMGRVNTELMYKNVMTWDWGNSDSDAIYHDPQTRRQSISYRTNLAKLVEQLIKEGKNDKAEKIIDLTLEKMPIKHFGYYIFTEPYIDGYFKIGKTDKAIAVYNQVKEKYIDYLEYYKSVKMSQQYDDIEEIYGYLEKYKSLVGVLDANNQKELLEKEGMLFQSYVEQFKHLFSDQEAE
jgi:tetratricopeptide (TPR) repeat protein